MRKLILALCLALPAVASGQGLTVLAPGKVPQKRTNYAFQSNSISTGTAITSPWQAFTATMTSPAAPASVGGGTWSEVTGTDAIGRVNQPVTTPSASVFLFSVFLQKSSGQYASIRFGCGTNTVTAASCGRSDGGTCTPEALGGNFSRVDMSGIGTDVIRAWVRVTCNAPGVAQTVTLMPGQYTVAAGTTRFAGAMLEVNPTKTTPSKICVTTTAAATCK